MGGGATKYSNSFQNEKDPSGKALALKMWAMGKLKETMKVLFKSQNCSLLDKFGYQYSTQRNIKIAKGSLLHQVYTNPD
jgi:hypothetical protein